MESSTTAPEAPMGVVSRIINLFVSPSKTFEALIVKPDWFTPVAVAMVIFLTVGILMKDVIQTEQVAATRESIMKNDKIDNSQKEQVIEQSTTMMKKFWFLGLPIGMVVVVIAYFLAALFLRIGGNMVLGKGPAYMQVLSVFSYSTLAYSAGALVRVPLMYLNQTMRVDTGLGMLLGQSETHSTLYIFLSKFDLFTFWQLAVLVIGLALLYKAPKGKTAGVVIGLWLIWILAVAGLSSVGIKIGG